MMNAWLRAGASRRPQTAVEGIKLLKRRPNRLNRAEASRQLSADCCDAATCPRLASWRLRLLLRITRPVYSSSCMPRASGQSTLPCALSVGAAPPARTRAAAGRAGSSHSARDSRWKQHCPVSVAGGCCRVFLVVESLLFSRSNTFQPDGSQENHAVWRAKPHSTRTVTSPFTVTRTAFGALCAYFFAITLSAESPVLLEVTWAPESFPFGIDR